MDILYNKYDEYNSGEDRIIFVEPVREGEIYFFVNS